MRDRSSVWLATAWGIVVTYVSSLAAMAYAASHATLLGAVASGIGAALIAAGVIWSARQATQPRMSAGAGEGVRALAVFAILTATLIGPGACRQLYTGPPVVTNRGSDGLVAKRVRAKREPDRLIAEDLSVCWVIPEVFAGVKPGDLWRCAWQ